MVTSQLGRPPKSQTTLTRRDLATALRSELGSSAAADKLVSAYFKAIESALVSGNTVSIHNFGRFTILQKKERMGRNPRTGESKAISARTVVTFKPSMKLRDKVKRFIGTQDVD